MSKPPMGLSVKESADRLRTIGSATDVSSGFRKRVYVDPASKVLFNALNKNACTSLKWMMAGICGEDRSTFLPRLGPFVTDLESVHDRALWKVMPDILDLEEELRSSIHPDNGWFVFAVVRDPRSRLFSAWQNKLLLNNPGYGHYRNQPWYPRHPITTESIVEDFERFVSAIESDVDLRIRVSDPHFRDQTEMLMLDTFPYSRVYDISEIGQLRSDLGAHLDNVGWEGRLDLPRSNDTPLRPNALVFADGVRERVEKIYRRDFEIFGDRWEYGRIEAGPGWPDDVLAEVELRAEFGRRLSDLRGHALRLRKNLASERDTVTRLQDKVTELERQLERYGEGVSQSRIRGGLAGLRAKIGSRGR